MSTTVWNDHDINVDYYLCASFSLFCGLQCAYWRWGCDPLDDALLRTPKATIVELDRAVTLGMGLRVPIDLARIVAGFAQPVDERPSLGARLAWWTGVLLWSVSGPSLSWLCSFGLPVLAVERGYLRSYLLKRPR